MSGLVAFARCRACPWQPNPKSRASWVTQADQHSDTEGHTVEYGQERPSEKEKGTGT